VLRNFGGAVLQLLTFIYFAAMDGLSLYFLYIKKYKYGFVKKYI